MQIVIEIPDKLYNDIEEMDWKNPIWADELYTSIHEGTVLPEHYGRLIDADTLECKSYFVSLGNGMHEEVKGYFNIDDAPTILEGTGGEDGHSNKNT